MPAILGAAGHAEGLMHVVERHDPLEKLSVFGGFRIWQNGGADSESPPTFSPSE